MRLPSFIGLAMLFCATALAAPSGAARQATSSADDEIARIVGHSFTGDGAMEFLETLTDGIGGRITGSPGSRAAAELILKELKQAGFDNAHSEEYKLSSVWEHGETTGEVTSPLERRLIVGSYGWVPGTRGPIEVPVTDYGLATADPAPPLDRFKGSAVIVDLRSSGLSTAYVGIRAVLAKRLASAGAAAMFIVSDKPDRMVYTSAFGFYPRAQ